MPLPSWRTGTTAQAAHGCKSTARPAGRGALFVTPPGKQPDACRSRCRTSRRAQCSRRLFFSCRGHAAVPISSGLGWLLMSGSMSGLRRAGTRGTARGRKVRRCFGRCFAAGVRRIGASWFVSGWQALRGQIWRICPPVIVARAKGRAVSKVPRLFIRQSLGMRIDAVHQFLKNLAH